MNIGELETVTTYDLPVKVCVLNNIGDGMVRQWQKLFFGGRMASTDKSLHKKDFIKAAQADGFQYAARLTSNDDVQRVVREWLEFKGPAFLEVMIDPDAGVYPMVGPGLGYDSMITGDFIQARKKPAAARAWRVRDVLGTDATDESRGATARAASAARLLRLSLRAAACAQRRSWRRRLRRTDNRHLRARRRRDRARIQSGAGNARSKTGPCSRPIFRAMVNRIPRRVWTPSRQACRQSRTSSLRCAFAAIDVVARGSGCDLALRLASAAESAVRRMVLVTDHAPARGRQARGGCFPADRRTHDIAGRPTAPGPWVTGRPYIMRLS